MATKLGIACIRVYHGRLEDLTAENVDQVVAEICSIIESLNKK